MWIGVGRKSSGWNWLMTWYNWQRCWLICMDGAGWFNDNSVKSYAEPWSGNLNPSSSKGQMCLTSKVVGLSLFSGCGNVKIILNSSRIFVDRGQINISAHSAYYPQENLCKNRRADLRASPQSLQAHRSGCSLHTALLKAFIWGGTPQANMVWHGAGGQSSSNSGNANINLSWSQRKAFSEEFGGVYPGHEEHNTDANRQEFSCIFLSFFCNKIQHHFNFEGLESALHSRQSLAQGYSLPEVTLASVSNSPVRTTSSRLCLSACLPKRLNSSLNGSAFPTHAVSQNHHHVSSTLLVSEFSRVGFCFCSGEVP